MMALLMGSRSVSAAELQRLDLGGTSGASGPTRWS